MKKLTPRQEIEKMNKLNGNEGFYGIHAQFVFLMENRLYQQASKIMDSLNTGFLWSNPREVHDTIYNYLLDGISVREIKNKFRA